MTSYLRGLTNCLIVYDNVVNYDEIKNFIPSEINGKIIVSSRKSFDDPKLGKINVVALEPAESKDFIATSLGLDEKNLPAEIIKLIEVLDGKPMALALAIAYIKKSPGYSENSSVFDVTLVEDYLNAYCQNNNAISSVAESKEDIQPTIVALLTNLKLVQQKYRHNWEILSLCTFLDKRTIPNEFFELKDKKKNTVIDTLPPLYDYRLVNKEDNRHVFVHELLQQVLKTELKKNLNEVVKTLFKAGHRIISLYLQVFGNPETPLRENLVTHSCSLLSAYKTVLSSTSEKALLKKLQENYALLLAMANDISHFRMTNVTDSIKYMEKVLADLEANYNKLLTPDVKSEADEIKKNAQHDEIKKIPKKLQLLYVSLGLAYFERGDNLKSRLLFWEGFRLAKKEEDHFNCAKLYGYIAHALQRSGHFMQSIQYFDLAIKSYPDHISAEDPIIAIFYSMVGNSYYHLGNYQLALENTEKALKLKSKFYEDENHIEVAFTKSYLSSVYYGMNNLTKAQEYIKAARRIIKTNPDKNLIRYSPSLIKHAQILHYEAISKKGKTNFHEANDEYCSHCLYSKVIRLCEKSIAQYNLYHKNHPFVIFAFLEISEALLAIGKYNEALKYLQEAYAFGYGYYEEVLSIFIAYQINPYIFWHENLDTFYQNNLFIKHIGTFKEILNITIKLYSKTHPCTARRYYDLGMSYYLNKEWNIAKHYFILAKACLLRIVKDGKFQFKIDINTFIATIEEKLTACKVQGVEAVLGDEVVKILNQFWINKSENVNSSVMPKFSAVQNAVLVDDRAIRINEKLKQRLQTWFTSKNLFSVLYVTGRPGVGKTFFAAQAINSLLKSKDALVKSNDIFVGWLIAYTEENFRMSLYQLVEQLAIEKIKDRKSLPTEFIINEIIAALSPKKNILIVIDDVYEYDLIKSFLIKLRTNENRRSLRIILTSRNNYFPLANENNIVQLDTESGLNKFDETDLHIEIAKCFKNTRAQSKRQIASFVKEMDLFSFSLTATFIRLYCYDSNNNPELNNIAYCIELYETFKKNNVPSIQILSILILLPLIKKNPQQMLKALYTLCFLNPYCISRSFFTDDVLKSLIAHNILIPVYDDNYFFINRSLQKIIFKLITIDKIYIKIINNDIHYDQCLEDILKKLQKEIDENSENGKYSLIVKTIPNFVRILKKYEIMSLRRDCVSQAIFSLKDYYLQIENNYSKAITFTKKYLLFRAVELSNFVSKNQQGQLLTALEELGHLCCELGKYQEGIIYYQEYVDIYDRGISRNLYIDGVVTKILERLGSAWNDLGYFHRASRYLHEALQESTEDNKLALINYRLSNFSETIKLMNGRKEFYSSELDGTLLIQNYSVLASSYYNIKDYDKARELQEVALEKAKQYYGEYHPETANIISNLGNILYAQGQFKEALQNQELAYERSFLFFGERSLRTAIILARLGKVEIASGKYDDAIFHCQTAIKIFKSYYSLSHPKVIFIYLLLSDAQYMKSQFVRSLNNLKQATLIGTAMYGSNLSQIFGRRVICHNEALEAKVINFNQDLQTRFTYYQTLFGTAHRRSEFLKMRLIKHNLFEELENYPSSNPVVNTIVIGVEHVVNKIHDAMSCRSNIEILLKRELNIRLAGSESLKTRNITKIFAFALSVNFRLDKCDSHGVYLFYEICRYGDINLIRGVLQIISKTEIQKIINKKTKAGWCPIVLAVFKNCTEITKLLVENGGDVNAYSEQIEYEIDDRNKIINRKYTCYLDSPLYWAIKNGNFELTKYLVENGADVSRTFNDGRNVLHLAVLSNSFKPDSSALNPNKILDLLLEKMTDEVVEELLQRPFGRLARTLLHQTVEIHNPTFVKELIVQYDLDLFKTTSDGRLIIQTARTDEMRSLLLHHFAKFYGVELLCDIDQNKICSEFHPANNRILQFIFYKLSLGNKKDLTKELSKNNVNRIIRLAVSLGNICRELINSFLDDAKIVEFLEFNDEYYGDYLLYMVAFGGSVEIMEQMLVIYQKKYNEMPSLRIINYNAWTPLMSSAFRQNTEMFDFLIEDLLTKKNARYVNHANRGGETALHLAVVNVDLNFVKKLLEVDADPSLPDIFGNTPIHLAARKGNAEILEVLLKNVKRIKSNNEDFKSILNRKCGRFFYTPLHEAVWSGNSDTVAVLLKYGADPFITAMHGRDAFDLINEMESYANITFATLVEGEKPQQSPVASRSSNLIGFFIRRSFEKPSADVQPSPSIDEQPSSISSPGRNQKKGS